MDPDLDPNLQHWQDRLDNFQWVVGSLVALLDSMQPGLSPEPRRAVRTVLLDSARRRRRHLGGPRHLPVADSHRPRSVSDQRADQRPVRMPPWYGLACNGRHRRGSPGIPLWTWLATVAGFTLGGPGDDIVFGGTGVGA